MFTSFIPLIPIFVIFYFLLIRPQQKKAKTHKEFLNNLSSLFTSVQSIHAEILLIICDTFCDTFRLIYSQTGDLRRVPVGKRVPLLAGPTCRHR